MYNVPCKEAETHVHSTMMLYWPLQLTKSAFKGYWIKLNCANPCMVCTCTEPERDLIKAWTWTAANRSCIHGKNKPILHSYAYVCRAVIAGPRLKALSRISVVTYMTFNRPTTAVSGSAHGFAQNYAILARCKRLSSFQKNRARFTKDSP